MSISDIDIKQGVHEILSRFQDKLDAVAELEKVKRKEFLSEDEVHMLFSIPASTLRTKRSRGQGPAYFKDGGKVFYKPSSVRTYLEARKVKTCDQF